MGGAARRRDNESVRLSRRKGIVRLLRTAPARDCGRHTGPERMHVDLFLAYAVSAITTPREVIGFIIAGLVVRNPAIGGALGALWATATLMFDASTVGAPSGLVIGARLTAGVFIAVIASIAGGFLFRRHKR